MEQETTSGEGGGMDLSALLGSLQGAISLDAVI